MQRGTIRLRKLIFQNKKTGLRSGLTLVELAVVVSIMGILIALTASSLSSIIRPSVESTSEKLMAAIKFCHDTAIMNSQTVILDLDISEDKYTAIRMNRTEDGIEEKKLFESSKLPEANSLVDITDMRGVRQEDGVYRIPFTKNGTSVDLNIHIGTSGNIKKTIIIYKYRGKVVLRDGEVNRTTGAGTASDVQKDDTPVEEL